jgi:hypothetical protein
MLSWNHSCPLAQSTSKFRSSSIPQKSFNRAQSRTIILVNCVSLRRSGIPSNLSHLWISMSCKLVKLLKPDISSNSQEQNSNFCNLFNFWRSGNERPCTCEHRGFLTRRNPLYLKTLRLATQQWTMFPASLAGVGQASLAAQSRCWDNEETPSRSTPQLIYTMDDRSQPSYRKVVNKFRSWNVDNGSHFVLK